MRGIYLDETKAQVLEKYGEPERKAVTPADDYEPAEYWYYRRYNITLQVKFLAGRLTIFKNDFSSEY